MNQGDKLKEYYNTYRRMPSYSEMMKLWGYRSKNAVFKVVEKLVEAGLISKDKKGKLIPGRIFDEVPLLGSVKAGFPSVAEEIHESMNVEDFLIDKKGESFILEVDGDSMIEAHITDGDLVVTRRIDDASAKDGDIVIAEIDGEWTMKYLRIAKRGRYLEAANGAYKPMYPTESLRVVAVVTAVIRKY